MTALDDIAAERRRQIEAEGWSTEHDDTHDEGHLAAAAASYAVHGYHWEAQATGGATLEQRWPWHPRWFKPSDRRRNLVKAGALIVAEIERLDRASPTTREGADR